MNNTNIVFYKPNQDPLNENNRIQDETYPIGPFYQQMKSKSQRNQSYIEFLSLQRQQDQNKICYSSVNELISQKQRNNSFQSLIQKLENQQNFRSSIDTMEKFSNQRYSQYNTPYKKFQQNEDQGQFKLQRPKFYSQSLRKSFTDALNNPKKQSFSDMKLKNLNQEMNQINRSVSQNFQKLNNPKYIEVIKGQQFVEAKDKLNSKNKLIKQITASRYKIEAQTKDSNQVFEKEASLRIYLSKINQQSQNQELQFNQNQEKTDKNYFNLLLQLKKLVQFNPLFQQLGLSDEDVAYQAELITQICLKGQFLKPPHDNLIDVKYNYKQFKQIKKLVYVELKNNKNNIESIHYSLNYLDKFRQLIVDTKEINFINLQDKNYFKKFLKKYKEQLKSQYATQQIFYNPQEFDENLEYIISYLLFIFQTRQNDKSYQVPKHKKQNLNLDNSQFLFLKQQLMKTLKNEDLPEKIIAKCILKFEDRRFDFLYKQTLIQNIQKIHHIQNSNPDDIKKCLNIFLARFNQLCYKDKDYLSCFQKMNSIDGYSMDKHNKHMIEFLINYEEQYSHSDLKLFHNNCKISPIMIQKTQNIYQSCLEDICQENQLQFQYYMKKFLQIKPIILKQENLKSKIGNICPFSAQFSEKINSNNAISPMFVQIDKSIQNHTEFMMLHLLQNKTYFSENDLVYAHSRLSLDKITFDSFKEDFIQSLKEQNFDDLIIKNIVSKLEENRLLIQSKK